jgi:O-antigen ligase
MGFTFVEHIDAVILGWMCLAASLFLAVRWPAANAFLPLSLGGMGGVSLIGNYTYARLTLYVGIITAIVLIVREGSERALSMGRILRSPLVWFAIVCLMIIIKICTDTVIYGLDADRGVNLMNGVQCGLFPVVVLLLSIKKMGLEVTAREVLIGMFVFPFLTVAAYMPFAFRQGVLLSAWYGDERFNLGATDTINSARILCYGAMAFMLAFSSRRGRWLVASILLLVVSCCFIGLLILTGNRQFFLAMLAFLILWAFFLGSSRKGWLAGIGMLVGITYVLTPFFVSRDFVIRERMSPEELRLEASESRGVIWANAFKTTLKNPILGTGFKNFGEEIDTLGKQGENMVLRDSAHGVFQDVFVEHGMILGIAFLAGCIQLALSCLRGLRKPGPPTSSRALTVALIALLLPLPFTSMFLNASPIYLLLILAMANAAPLCHNRRGLPQRQN